VVQEAEVLELLLLRLVVLVTALLLVLLKVIQVELGEVFLLVVVEAEPLRLVAMEALHLWVEVTEVLELLVV
jgi:hypothetical protein